MNENIPPEVVDMLLNGRKWHRSGAQDLLIDMVPGEIRETKYNTRTLQAFCTNPKCRAYGIKVRTVEVNGKRYVLCVSKPPRYKKK